MNRVFGHDVRYVTTIGLSQIAGGQLLQVFSHGIGSTAAKPARWVDGACRPGCCRRRPEPAVVALSGDYDFQFLIEELAVGAQFNLPYVHVLVNNSYLGPDPPGPAQLRHGLLRVTGLRQHQLPGDRRRRPQGLRRRSPAVAEGLGCKAIQVVEPQDIGPSLARAQRLPVEHKVPVVVEVFLEKITNIAMGTEIDNVVEFNDLAESLADAPTAAALLVD